MDWIFHPLEQGANPLIVLPVVNCAAQMTQVQGLEFSGDMNSRPAASDHPWRDMFPIVSGRGLRMRFSKRRYGEGLCPESVRQVALRIVVVEILHARPTKVLCQFLEKAPIRHNVIRSQSNDHAIRGQI